MGSRSYLEHVAIRVRDIEWHLGFFRQVLGMTIREEQAPAGKPRQVWTLGGLQFIADPDFAGPEGRLAHLGVMTENLEAALAAAQALGVHAMPERANWLTLPDGLVVELIEAQPGSVAAALAVQARP